MITPPLAPTADPAQTKHRDARPVDWDATLLRFGKGVQEHGKARALATPWAVQRLLVIEAVRQRPEIQAADKVLHALFASLSWKAAYETGNPFFNLETEDIGRLLPWQSAHITKGIARLAAHGAIIRESRGRRRWLAAEFYDVSIGWQYVSILAIYRIREAALRGDILLRETFPSAVLLYSYLLGHGIRSEDWNRQSLFWDVDVKVDPQYVGRDDTIARQIGLKDRKAVQKARDLLVAAGLIVDETRAYEGARKNFTIRPLPRLDRDQPTKVTLHLREGLRMPVRPRPLPQNPDPVRMREAREGLAIFLAYDRQTITGTDCLEALGIPAAIAEEWVLSEIYYDWRPNPHNMANRIGTRLGGYLEFCDRHERVATPGGFRAWARTARENDDLKRQDYEREWQKAMREQKKQERERKKQER